VINVGDFIWSYVGGIGSVVTKVSDVSDPNPLWQVMNSSICGASYVCRESDLEAFVITFVDKPSADWIDIGEFVTVGRELWKVEGYLHSAAFAANLYFLQGVSHPDRQCTCYRNEATPLNPYG
jgi:hypothetical protein